MRLNLATETYELPSLPASAKRLLNVYPESLPADARSDVILKNTPGLGGGVYILGTGPINAMNGELSGRLYVVSGTQFIRIRPDDEMAPELLMDVGTVQNGFASIAVGTTACVVCIPPNAFVCGHSDPLYQITDPNFIGASSVAYIDGYFVFTAWENSSRFFCSNLLDGTTYDSLNFAYADGRPNVIRRVIQHRGDLWFIGESGLEVWYDAGNVNFPFLRRPGTDIPFGCVSPQTVAICDDAIFYLTSSGVVLRIDGYSPTRVSTFAIEDWIRRENNYYYVDACSYSQDGHSFYCLTFMGNTQRTYTYDPGIKRWHERSSAVGGEGPWIGRYAATRGAQILIGDRYSGTLYTPDAAASNDAAVELTRIITFPQIWADTKRGFMSRLEIEMETGLASKNANILLEISDDGGKTYRQREIKYTGVNGEKLRVFWTRLGSFRDRVLRLTLYDVCNIYGADADLTQGDT